MAFLRQPLAVVEQIVRPPGMRKKTWIWRDGDVLLFASELAAVSRPQPGASQHKREKRRLTTIFSPTTETDPHRSAQRDAIRGAHLCKCKVALSDIYKLDVAFMQLHLAFYLDKLNVCTFIDSSFDINFVDGI